MESKLKDKVIYFKGFKTALEELSKEVHTETESALKHKTKVLIATTECNFLYSEIMFISKFLKETSEITDKDILEFNKENLSKFYTTNLFLEKGELKERVTGFLDSKVKDIQESNFLTEVLEKA